jgi:heme/copper-type cytochrome/quinol oxidase subunit 1
MNERVGRLVYGLVFVGFNLTFLPMHILGLPSMPRRIYTYQPDLPWDGLNQFVSLSSCLRLPASCCSSSIYHAQHRNRFARGQ